MRIVTCPTCGEVFETTYSNKVYCDMECQENRPNRWRGERYRLRMREYMRVYRAAQGSEARA